MHRDEVLAAGLGPRDRASGGARQPAQDHILDVEALAAEAAADVGRDHADLLGLEPEHEPEDQLVLVWGLGRQPDGQPAVVAELGDRRPRLDRAGREPLALVRARDDHIAAVEQLRVGILRRNVDAGVGTDVLEQQHLVAQRLAQVGHDRQRLVLDHHQLGGVVGALAGLAQHDGDDVADEPHLLRREERPEDLGRDLDERRRRVDVRSVSAAVNTCVPGSASAADLSIPRICAWACRSARTGRAARPAA